MERKQQIKQQILSFLQDRPLISQHGLEIALGMPQSTIGQALSGARELPTKWVFPLILELIPYGLQLDGFSWSIDPETNYIFGRKWIENIRTEEFQETSTSSSITYIVREHRNMACDLTDLI